jgi:hypothetical protein
LAVAGWDADGNGVLLISEFAAHQEARRMAYHVLVKNTTLQNQQESEEERRRRRARGWKPSAPETPEDVFGNLQISDGPHGNSTTQILATNTVDDDFCEVVVERTQTQEPVIEQVPTSTDNNTILTSLASASMGKEDYSSTLQDSVRTEPLDEEEPASAPSASTTTATSTTAEQAIITSSSSSLEATQ